MSISARELRALLIEMHASQNLTRRRLIDALPSLSEARLYLQLGFPTIAAKQPLEKVRPTKTGHLG